MRHNAYDPAEAVEVGKAEDIILGTKDLPEIGDFSGNPPLDRLWVE